MFLKIRCPKCQGEIGLPFSQDPGATHLMPEHLAPDEYRIPVLYERTPDAPLSIGSSRQAVMTYRKVCRLSGAEISLEYVK